MNGWLLIGTATAGGAGSALRFLIDTAVRNLLGARFPWGTTMINITGSFVLGLIVGLGASVLSGVTTLTLGTGLMGGYTTFSAASVETVRLMLDRRLKSALANAVVNLAACVVAAIAGLALSR